MDGKGFLQERGRALEIALPPGEAAEVGDPQADVLVADASTKSHRFLV